MFFSISFSGGYQADYSIFIPVAVTHDQHARFQAQAKHQKSIFFSRMLGVVEAERIFIEEDSLCFFKRHAMLSYVFRILSRIPVKYRV